MRKKKLLVAVVLILLIGLGANTLAQEWSDEQKEVWSAVADNWDLYAKQDIKWLDFAHPDSLHWSGSLQMPRSKDVGKEWHARFYDPNSTILIHEINPAGIVVQGNTAVLHYFYSVGTQNKQGEQAIEKGRCTDVLIREKGRWWFLGWNCNDAPDSDD